MSNPSPTATPSYTGGSLFNVRLNLPLEYMPMIHDLVRMACIQFVAQFMFFVTNATEPMFSVMFVQTLCFLLLGVLVYWLIIQKLLRIETTQFPKAAPSSPPPSTADVLNEQDMMTTATATATATVPDGHHDLSISNELADAEVIDDDVEGTMRNQRHGERAVRAARKSSKK